MRIRTVIIVLLVGGCGPGLVNPSTLMSNGLPEGALPRNSPDGLPDDAVITTRDENRPDPVGGGERIARLTPEQVSNQLRQSLNVGVGYFENGVLMLDYLTEDFAVPLGGLSLSNYVRRRDRLTKVQTILVTRQVAWIAAVNLTNNENQDPPPENTIFTKSRYLEDHPGGESASRTRWHDQVQDFYRRLFSRSATDDEIKAIEATFSAVYDREGTTPPAWLVTFYSLISSMETWNTWR